MIWTLPFVVAIISYYPASWAGLGRIIVNQVLQNQYIDNFLGDKFMDPTFGLFLVIGFPTLLCMSIWAFGKFSQEPE